MHSFSNKENNWAFAFEKSVEGAPRCAIDASVKSMMLLRLSKNNINTDCDSFLLVSQPIEGVRKPSSFWLTAMPQCVHHSTHLP